MSDDTDNDQEQELSPDTDDLLSQALSTPVGASSSGDEVAGPVSSDPDKYLRERLRSQLLAQALGGNEAQSSSTTKSSLASAAPSWYTPEAPPKGPGPVLGSLAQLAGNRAQKTADLAAAEPLKPYAQKVAAQRHANQAALIGGLFGALGNRKQAAYQQDQDAALKQAQMQRTLREGSQNQATIALGGLNYLLNEDRFKRQTDLDKQKAELDARKNTVDSPESRAAQESAKLWAHHLTPEQISGMSAYQLERYRTALMQDENNTNRAEEKDRGLYNTDVYKRSAENREQEQKVLAEQRKEQQRQAEFAPPQGYAWGGGHPPDPETARNGKQFVAASHLVDQGAQRLKEIQHQLEQGGGIVPGALGGYALTQAVALNDQQKALVQEARQVQRAMVNAYREQAHYGALTGHEQEYANEMNQAAASPQGYFIGDAGWDALVKQNQLQRATTLPEKFNLFEQGKAPKGSSPIDRAPSEQIQRAPVPPLKGFRGQAAPAGPEAQPEPQQQQQSGVVGTFTIRTKDPASGQLVNSRPAQMTREQFERAVQAVGVDNVIRMQ